MKAVKRLIARWIAAIRIRLRLRRMRRKDPFIY